MYGLKGIVTLFFAKMIPNPYPKRPEGTNRFPLNQVKTLITFSGLLGSLEIISIFFK
jgi:hypothetical protein